MPHPRDRVDPSDPRYPTLVRGFNLRWVGKPEWIQLCGDTREVLRIVQHAVDHGKRITVRGGGHCYENFSAGNDGGVIIDLAPMNRVSFDDAEGAFCIEGGCTLWNVYWNLYKEFGVALPAGSCYSVGAGGHITGGGYGLLSRKHGLTVDWLTAVEIVRVDANGRAERVIVRRESEPQEERDLLWATQGGGGGNFGIVTRFFFDELPPAPPVAHVANLAWNWSELTEESFTTLVRRYGEFLAQNSGVDSPYDGLFTLLHLGVQAASQISMAVQYVGDRPELLAEFVNFLTGDGRAGRVVPQTHMVGRHRFPIPTNQTVALPWLYATQTLDLSGANQRGKYKSAYMIRPFPETQIATIWKHLTNGFANSQSLLQIDSYGCRINAVAPDATAVPQRSSIMKLQYQTYWTDEPQTEENLQWIRAFYDEMYGPDGPMPDGTMDGCYVNYPDCDLKNWQSLYYLAAYPRLQRTKRAWDPRNVFHHAQSIELP